MTQAVPNWHAGRMALCRRRIVFIYRFALPVITQIGVSSVKAQTTLAKSSASFDGTPSGLFPLGAYVLFGLINQAQSSTPPNPAPEQVQASATLL